MDDEIDIVMPGDAHRHFRGNPGDAHSEAIFRTLLKYTTPQWAWAVRMPNRKPVDTSGERIAQYNTLCEQEIRKLPTAPNDFQFVSVYYLHDHADPSEIEYLIDLGLIDAVKRYPANATTGSEEGVSDLFRPNLLEVFAVLEARGIPFLSHSAHTCGPDGEEYDFYDWEILDINNLKRLRELFPNLKIIVEHASTEPMIIWVHGEYRRGSPTAATLTPHHGRDTRNALFKGGKLWPNMHMLPPLMPIDHVKAVRWAMVSGLPCFFAGTDDAAHDVLNKESEPCSGGVCNVLNAIPAYVEVFEEEDALDPVKIEGFLSLNAIRFYGEKLVRGVWVEIVRTTTRRLRIVRESFTMPRRIPISDGISYIVPYLAGGKMRWQVPVMRDLIGELC